MQVKFRLKNAQTKWGQNLAIVGSSEAIGKWKSEKAPLMTTNQKMFPKWESKQNITFGSHQQGDLKCLEYKYIMVNDKGGDPVWEGGDNRKVDLSSFAGRDGIVVVEDDGFNQKHRPAKVYPEGTQ